MLHRNLNEPFNNLSQCALHFMLSTSIETRVRGDEAQRCNQLAQYRSVRVPRDAKGTEDFEMLKTPEMANVRKRLHQKFGRYAQEDEAQAEAEEENAEDPEAVTEDEEANDEALEIGEQNTGLVDVASNAISSCPVENGVLQSPWGSVSGGTVIAGIAAGLERQTVTVRDLVTDDHMGQYRSARQQVGVATVDNRFAATLSGDIAEAILRQIPADNIQVGASGAWNNSAVPRWFFLSQRERLEMTDAEIRGGIDGLTIATNILQWRERAQNLRLSQVLDMYYSQRGIFGMVDEETAIRACNRRNNFPIVAPMQQLRDQSFAFTTVLDGEMQSQVTLSRNSTVRISAQASDALHAYVSELLINMMKFLNFNNEQFPTRQSVRCYDNTFFSFASFFLFFYARFAANTLNDLTCAGTATVPNDNTIWRAATDIYIFIDVSWPFRDIQTMIGWVWV